MAGRLVELEGDAEGRFIGEERWWRRGAAVGAPDCELCSSLMAAGPAVALEATLGGGA